MRKNNYKFEFFKKNYYSRVTRKRNEIFFFFKRSCNIFYTQATEHIFYNFFLRLIVKVNKCVNNVPVISFSFIVKNYLYDLRIIRINVNRT